MLRLTDVACVIACMCLFLGGTAMAQGELTEEMRAIPGGWSQSCRDFHLVDYRLGATCPDQNGEWKDSRPSWYDAWNCQSTGGKIENDNGRLTCIGGESPGFLNSGWGVPLTQEQSAKIPGSWSSVCRYPRLDGTVLVAQCRNPNAKFTVWTNQSIDLRPCNTSIENTDGKLSCVVGAAPEVTEALPQKKFLTTAEIQKVPGGWVNSCKNPWLEGTVLYAECLDHDTGNSVTSSIDLTPCNSDTTVEFLDRQLTCAAPAEAAASAEAPSPAENPNFRRLTAEEMRDIPGPWFESCQNAVVDEGRSSMSADCPGPDGALIRSSIDLSACGSGSTVVNDGGGLVCE